MTTLPWEGDLTAAIATAPEGSRDRLTDLMVAKAEAVTALRREVGALTLAEANEAMRDHGREDATLAEPREASSRARVAPQASETWRSLHSGHLPPRDPEGLRHCFPCAGTAGQTRW